MKKQLICLVIGIATHSLSHAALIARGSGLIYSTGLNVTWLSSTNVPSTYSQAVDWIETLNSNRYLGYDDWRLPQTLPVNGVSYNVTHSYDGSTDWGWNITSENSEMAYLYYVELGNLSYFNTSGLEPQTGWGLSNVGPFTGLDSTEYWWSGTEAVAPGINFSDVVFTFRMKFGDQRIGPMITEDPMWGFPHLHGALALRDGDVTIIPEVSTTALMFTLGIIWTAGLRSRTRRPS